jgi:hypothetical protein
MIAVFATALFSCFRLAIVCSFPYASQKGAATANSCCRPLGNDIKASALHELRYWIDQGPLEPLRRKAPALAEPSADKRTKLP